VSGCEAVVIQPFKNKNIVVTTNTTTNLITELDRQKKMKNIINSLELYRRRIRTKITTTSTTTTTKARTQKVIEPNIFIAGNY